ncbi:hypothetical protein OS31_13290 [Dickeya oryzae]
MFGLRGTSNVVHTQIKGRMVSIQVGGEDKTAKISDWTIFLESEVRDSATDVPFPIRKDLYAPT